ncbi:MAG TPA: PAS domain S-box protein [Clostridiales bacterium]|jgi:PAS domain S-box-containing protein|nr:PAS domain S-box protein [Clostridiales bacterium]HQP70022.1 PAS domain S-box protein [Clostridiales bacterium]
MAGNKTYSENDIKKALTFIEIFDKADEIDCGGCGYKTCREFAAAMLDGTAKPSMCVVLSKKIIEKLKKKEKELRDSLFLNQEILDAVPAPILYEDIEGRAIGCNKAYEDIAGIKRFDIKDKKLFEYSDNKLYNELNEKLNASLLKNPVKQVVEADVKYPGGDTITIELHKAVFTDRSGAAAGFVSVLFDITERVKRSRELAIAKDTAELSVSLLKKMPSGFVIVDDRLTIIESNSAFAKLMGDDIEVIEEINPGLKGADLRSVFSHHQLFSALMESGEDTYSKDVVHNGKKMNITLFTIEKNKTAGAVFLDLSMPDVRNEEVRKRAENVIRENLDTVQKIAYLLGENASKTENVLSSVIRLLSENEK